LISIASAASYVLDEFATPVEWKPMNTCEILDEIELEDGDRVTDALKLLDVQAASPDNLTR
jgi:hypothetical protein